MPSLQKPELLAPAGDFEKLVIAVHYGANAVYFGSSDFSLRAKAANFSDEELAEAVRYCRERDTRAYVTVNIFPHESDLHPIEQHLELLAGIGPDAVILSDPGVLRMLHRLAPGIPAHVSTQANVTNSEAACFWEDMGARRIILARELSVEEILRIRNRTGVELEAFVHGAICLSYSGRCYISSHLAARSANRGLCTNSCRWNYALVEEKRPGQYMPVFENERGTFLMYPRDLCMIGHLPELADAGVCSFKIEGRMKGINYVGGVVHAYRKAVDRLHNRTAYDQLVPLLHEELAMFSSRGYTTGMFFGRHPDDGYNITGRWDHMTHDLVGIVKEINDGVATISLKNKLAIGDSIQYLSPSVEDQHHTVETMHDPDGNYVTLAKNEDTVTISVPAGVRVNDLIRRPQRKEA